MRSAGYFHITKDDIQRCLHERFIFLKESESQDYISLMHTTNETNDNTPQKNTRLGIRKMPIDGKEKSPRFKDNIKMDSYPWLDDNDPRRHMTGKEIHETTIGLSEACITEKLKHVLYNIPLKYREPLSLKDEIGLCPNIKVKLELEDKTPFYIRPFPIKEEEKIIVDKEMHKGCSLGILRKGFSS